MIFPELRKLFLNLESCVMIPIGPIRTLRVMSRTVSSRSSHIVKSSLVYGLGRVSSPMSPVVSLEAFYFRTILHLTWQTDPFFTYTDTLKSFF
jgi:hypothetical protein